MKLSYITFDDGLDINPSEDEEFILHGDWIKVYHKQVLKTMYHIRFVREVGISTSTTINTDSNASQPKERCTIPCLTPENKQATAATLHIALQENLVVTTPIEHVSNRHTSLVMDNSHNDVKLVDLLDTME